MIGALLGFGVASAVSNKKYARGGKVIESEAFKKWFGDSKVVDGNGNPLVVYHQTQEKFNVFDLDKEQGFSGFFWFTSDKGKIERGETGASGASEGKKTHIIPAFLSSSKLGGWDEYDKWSTASELIREGYDGLKLDDDYIVFAPTQIKSAIGNSGEFDENNPDITMAKGGSAYAGGGEVSFYERIREELRH